MNIKHSYTASSLADIAEEFESRADEQSAIASTARTQLARERYSATALTWQLAAEVLRATTIEVAP